MEDTPKIITSSATEKLRKELASNQPTNTATQEAPAAEVKVEPKVEVPKTEAPKAEVKEVKKEEVVTPQAEQSDTLKAFLAQHNISSLSELEEKITPKRVKTQDEEESELIDWSVKNDNMKVDDFLSAKEIQKKKDADVVFDEFAAKLQAKNKNITPEEIQAKFNKKFGDEVDVIEEGVVTATKLVLDNEDIAEEAKRIRESRLQPINSAKSKFQNYTKDQDFRNQVIKEFNTIAKGIPDKVPIRIDDKNTFEYELEPSYKEKLLPKLAEQYAFFRKNSPNEKFDAEQFMNHVSSVVMQDNFGNIANIYAGKKVSEKDLEYSKKLENPIVKPIDLNTGNQPSVDMKAEAAKLGKQLRQL